MANYDQRLILDDRFGQISGAITASATIISSPEFASLPSDLSPTRYIPIVLADDSSAAKLYEIVWATAHVEGSTSITVVRGREGSTAKTWGTGTAWRCAMTARDGLMTVPSRTALPTDAHIGMRVVIRDDTADGSGRCREVQKVATGWKATEPIFGHAGRTAGNQANAGVIQFTAAQELVGDMRFTSGGLVVPVPGIYQATIRHYVNGATAGRYTAAPRVNGAAPAQSGPVVQANKPDNGDYSQIATQGMRLSAQDLVTVNATWPSGDNAWGTNGYDGAWLELLYMGP